MQNTINITGQIPAKLYDKNLYTPIIDPSYDGYTFLNEIAKEIQKNLSKPLFEPSGKVSIKINNQTWDEIHLTSLLLKNLTSNIINISEEELLNELYESSLRHLIKNKLRFDQIIISEILTKFNLAQPKKIPKLIRYTAKNHLIQQAKFLFSDMTNSDEQMLWQGYLGAYLHDKLATSPFTFKNDEVWNEYKTFLSTYLKNNLNNISKNEQSILSDILKIDLKHNLGETFITNTPSNKDNSFADANLPFSAHRILHYTLSEFLKNNPDTVLYQCISLSEMYFPTNITIINLESYTHASPEEINSEWNKTAKALTFSSNLKIISKKKLKTARQIARQISKPTQKPNVSTREKLVKGAKRKFAHKPITAKKSITMMLKIMKNRETNMITTNTYKIIKPTFMQPSRRDPNNINLMGKTKNIKYRPDIHIYIDTSGSITESNYKDAVMNLIILAKKANVNLYITSFSDYISDTYHLKTKNRSIKDIYKKFSKLETVSGGTDFSLVWEKIKKLDKWNRKNRKSYQINFMITDFGYSVRQSRHFSLNSPEVKNLYYVPISTDKKDWNKISSWAEEFAKQMILAGDIHIKDKMLL